VLGRANKAEIRGLCRRPINDENAPPRGFAAPKVGNMQCPVELASEGQGIKTFSRLHAVFGLTSGEAPLIQTHASRLYQAKTEAILVRL